MRNWKLLPIKDTGKVITGTTPSTEHEEFYGGDVPFITPTELDFNDPYSISQNIFIG